MSRPRRNLSDRKVRRDDSVGAARRRLFGLLFPIVLALIAGGIPFYYGKYLEFGSDSPFDGALNIYMAKKVVDGATVGVDVFPSANPGTLFVNVVGVWLFGYSEFGPKLIQFLMQLSALSLMFYTLRRVYGSTAAIFGVVVAAFFLSCPPFVKYGNVKEQYMIVLMVVSACSLILRHFGGNWWLLLLAGASAIGGFFFKQTAGSMIAAIGLYILLRPLLRWCKWGQFIRELGLLLLGGLIGLLPLFMFYGINGNIRPMIRHLPYGSSILRTLNVKPLVPRDIEGRLSPQWWAAPAAKAARPATSQSQKPKNSARRKGNFAGGYVAASRQVTTFAAQYDWMMRYYRILVVPIGFGLFAVVLGLIQLISSIVTFAKGSRRKEGSRSKVAVDRVSGRFILFLGLWWLLDLLFGWVSPRSYVEYFLPLAASGAMLAGYIVWRCVNNHWYWAGLLAVWSFLHVFVTFIVPGDGLLGLGIRRGIAEGYWGHFFARLIPAGLVVIICVFIRSVHLRPIRGILSCGVVVFSLLWWIGLFGFASGGQNIEAFSQKVSELARRRAEGSRQVWQRVGEFIRERSEPSDGLHVWGWFPGIYVSSERFSPARQAAYSDMHTDLPRMVRYNTTRLCAVLRAEPPKFIVDPQKQHYPYYTHPNFELWPKVGTADGKERFLTAEPELIASFSKQLLERVESYTYQSLRSPSRQGGPVEESEAAYLAQREARRHNVMYPLRGFVMLNYRPVCEFRVNPAQTMVVFERLSDVPIR